MAEPGGSRFALPEEWDRRVAGALAFVRRRITGEYEVDDFGFDPELTEAVLMPLLGSVAAFGLARSGQLLIRGVIGMALGFLYFVVDNAAIAIGNFGGYPPLIAAWTPFFLFAFVCETVLVRTEE